MEMDQLFKACKYPTAALADMISWNNLVTDNSVSNDATFANSYGIMSVGLFGYDMSCLW